MVCSGALDQFFEHLQNPAAVPGFFVPKFRFWSERHKFCLIRWMQFWLVLQTTLQCFCMIWFPPNSGIKVETTCRCPSSSGLALLPWHSLSFTNPACLKTNYRKPGTNFLSHEKAKLFQNYLFNCTQFVHHIFDFSSNQFRRLGWVNHSVSRSHLSCGFVFFHTKRWGLHPGCHC